MLLVWIKQGFFCDFQLDRQPPDYLLQFRNSGFCLSIRLPLLK